jgi:hypothetical protein
MRFNGPNSAGRYRYHEANFVFDPLNALLNTRDTRDILRNLIEFHRLARFL